MGWTRGAFLLASVTDDGEAGGEYNESLTTALGLLPNGEKDFFGIVADDAPPIAF